MDKFIIKVAALRQCSGSGRRNYDSNFAFAPSHRIASHFPSIQPPRPPIIKGTHHAERIQHNSWPSASSLFTRTKIITISTASPPSHLCTDTSTSTQPPRHIPIFPTIHIPSRSQPHHDINQRFKLRSPPPKKQKQKQKQKQKKKKKETNPRPTHPSKPKPNSTT
ncbi:uncharacterized protein BT62DRAFT_1079213 [Guyanagaster necrorhizus]|uniref:Uncharacterized protein n=1 Tax=Guyanagaster necrorhizus TaxID=856835 RepID=A0A9P7VME3_9AGAR|nr:uncharacterized protein BT62DRAFT_1079213 [Guyanagaster necrorhizus MCA 3950]KAG7442616.1 hypothetical protein BT62DRAFT_1079213 [Guyanagaster necrorhizus MCA 3950]